MNKERVLAFLDAEIQRLQQARDLLSSTEDTTTQSISSGRSSRGRGTHRGGVRHMSADARRRISEAQKDVGLREKAAAVLLEDPSRRESGNVI